MSLQTYSSTLGDPSTPPLFCSDDSTTGSSGNLRIIYYPNTWTPWPGPANNITTPFTPIPIVGVFPTIEIYPTPPDRVEELERRVQELEKKLAEKQEAAPAAPAEQQELPKEPAVEEPPGSGVDTERFKKL